MKTESARNAEKTWTVDVEQVQGKPGDKCNTEKWERVFTQGE